MAENKKIKKALISVYHKDQILDIANELIRIKCEIISTGGTCEFLESHHIPVTKVESITEYPSIFGGRVKTLHPKICGGILTRRDIQKDKLEREQYNIPEIDLVIVDLYPFEETVKSGAVEKDIIEKIDIGGITLIRAAAKNYKDVVIVPSQNQYKDVLNLLIEKNGMTSIEERRDFATAAFVTSSHYDSAICAYFNQETKIPIFNKNILEHRHLRYGENPHQNAAYFGPENSLPEQLYGKELSYNNMQDVEAACELISDIPSTAVAIIKHTNACGCAMRTTVLEAWKEALSSDPLSAFGGIFTSNATIDKATAEEMDKLFFEIVIAPDYDDEALEILKHKKNRRILKNNKNLTSSTKFRSLLNGVLVQDKDNVVETEKDLQLVTKKRPTQKEIDDLLFANILVKHSKSNAIVLAKDSKLVASGIGQTSRVDALKQAIRKAKYFKLELNGAVMASDAFFPFPDCVEIAHKEGIDAVIHPGGSIKDSDSFEYCDNHNMTMVITGKRHFKH
ncbi:MAG: bifunctional phosphoribosylaminoimidazolecarboxamide formyltransferase/IMP cyclohydrolase [Bacteroidales bacterium]